MVLDIVFGAVLLAVVTALVLLFAMLGELASRLPEQGRSAQTVRSREVRPLEDARLGVEPRTWPTPLAGISDTAGQSVVLVLSTACSTCSDVAGQLAAELDAGADGDMAVVVSTGDPGRAEEFLDKYGLRRLRHHVDDKGDWVSREFGIRMSPTAMVFHSGRLQSALVFQDIDALRETVTEPKGVA
jgi:hypothetical protein